MSLLRSFTGLCHGTELPISAQANSRQRVKPRRGGRSQNNQLMRGQQV